MQCLLERRQSAVVQGKPPSCPSCNYAKDALLTCIVDSGYTCTTNPGHAQTCRRIAGYGDSFALATCSNDGVTDYSTRTLPFSATRTVGGTITSNQVATYALFNPMVEIRFRTSDLAAFTSSSSDLTSGSISGSNPTSSATASSSQIANRSSGLSTGAQVGIGIGVALGALVLVGSAFVLWRKPRKSPQPQSNDSNSREPQIGIYSNHDPSLSAKEQHHSHELEGAASAPSPQEMYAGGMATR